MSDLHDKARALLTLREKATPGPWVRKWGTILSPSTTNEWVGSVQTSNVDNWEDNANLIAAAHDMADTIAALLAENERLKATPPDYVKVVTRLTYRAEAAEARYAALCEAEPVAYGFPNTAITGSGPTMMMLRHEVPADDQYQGAFWLPLIPRPSMEKTP